MNVADCLFGGEKSINELSQHLSCCEKKLYRVMRYLASRGIFNELENKVFQLNAESKCLVSSVPGNINNFIELHAKYFYQGASELFESLSSDKTSFELAFDKSAGGLFNDCNEAGKVYHHSMHDNSNHYSKLLVEQYDFSKCNLIVDVGGGLGSLIINILK
jgi:hypothetical protein